MIAFHWWQFHFHISSSSLSFSFLQPPSCRAHYFTPRASDERRAPRLRHAFDAAGYAWCRQRCYAMMPICHQLSPFHFFFFLLLSSLSFAFFRFSSDIIFIISDIIFSLLSFSLSIIFHTPIEDYHYIIINIFIDIDYWLTIFSILTYYLYWLFSFRLLLDIEYHWLSLHTLYHWSFLHNNSFWLLPHISLIFFIISQLSIILLRYFH